MNAQVNDLDFADDENDCLASVTELPREKQKKSESTSSVSANSGATKLSILRNRYVLGFALLALATGATVGVMGPNQFVQTISNYSLPTFGGEDSIQQIFEQKIQAIEAQAASAKEIAEAVGSRSNDQASNLHASAKAAMEMAKSNKEILTRLQENQLEILKRIQSLEQEVLLIATSGGDAGIDDLQASVASLKSSISDVVADVTKNTKNVGWLANRADALEKWKEVQTSPRTEKSVESVSNQVEHTGAPVVETSPWVIKLANFKAQLGFLLNTVTGEKLRVKPGVNVPNCGVITKMSTATNSITAGHCVITKG